MSCPQNQRSPAWYDSASRVRQLLFVLVLAACGDSTGPDGPGLPDGPGAGGVVPVLNESFSDASTAEYVVSEASPEDFSGFSASVTAHETVYGTATVTATQGTQFHQGATPGQISAIQSSASSSVSLVTDEQDRTGGGKGSNVISLTFEVTGQAVGFDFQGSFTVPSDSRFRGDYSILLTNLDAPSDPTGLSESGSTTTNIQRQGSLSPGRYRLRISQLAEALIGTEGAAESSWDVRLEFLSE